MPDQHDKPHADPADQPTVHHQSAARRRPRPASGMQLNLPAMIDIIFLLLIYFVITANFMLDEGVLTTQMPHGAGEVADPLAPPPTPLNIRLAASSGAGVSINVADLYQPASFTELAELLESMQYDPQRQRAGMYKADDPVIIRPAGDVRWQHALNALNAAIKARYSNVQFAPAP